MSYFPSDDPHCSQDACPDAVEHLIVPRVGDVGNFEVYRALPTRERQMVGPFIFWDQMGPGEFLTEQGLDVRPHPHIGLSTLTYLFDGDIYHQDSLGVKQVISPGDVNFMTAGSGIVHSERTPQDLRSHSNRLFGIQSWMALPQDQEECDPDFTHIPKEELPELSDKGMHARLISGSLWGERSPLQAHHECLYVDVSLEAGTTISIPPDVEERALYPLGGLLEIGGKRFEGRQMFVLRPGKPVDVTAITPIRMMILGGAAMDGPRHIWWNLVSSRKERIQEAKQAWKQGLFPVIPEDQDEFTPLP